MWTSGLVLCLQDQHAGGLVMQEWSCQTGLDFWESKCLSHDHELLYFKRQGPPCSYMYMCPCGTHLNHTQVIKSILQRVSWTETILSEWSLTEGQEGVFAFGLSWEVEGRKRLGARHCQGWEHGHWDIGRRLGSRKRGEHVYYDLPDDFVNCKMGGPSKETLRAFAGSVVVGQCSGSCSFATELTSANPHYGLTCSRAEGTSNSVLVAAAADPEADCLS